MRYILIIIIGISVLAFSCKSRTDSLQQKQTAIQVNPDAVMLLDISIQGMTCTGCENTVKSSIAELPGVVEVSASFVDGKALVKVDTTLTRAEKISDAVTRKGYTVTGYKEAELIP